MDAVERIIQHAVQKSRDGRIDVSDFLNEAAGSMRYGMFTPMEVSKLCNPKLIVMLGKHNLALCVSRRYGRISTSSSCRFPGSSGCKGLHLSVVHEADLIHFLVATTAIIPTSGDNRIRVFPLAICRSHISLCSGWYRWRYWSLCKPIPQ